MTASSVTSLSIDPPAILVCVNKDASIHDTLVKDVSLCINILQKNQQEISNLCSSKDLESQRFENDFWDLSDTPFLKDAQANIFCKIDQTHPYHSHTIVLAKALKAQSLGEFNTLMYGDGRYLS
jgi:flavin reductase (DIM6/NTAB) family NADH-FMN oxidoreductase RutF